MTYRIDYAPEKTKKSTELWTKLRLQALTAGLLLLFTLGARYAWPEGRARLREVFLVSEMSQTGRALQAMVDRISDGEPFGEAVTTFCQQVLDDARGAE